MIRTHWWRILAVLLAAGPILAGGRPAPAGPVLADNLKILEPLVNRRWVGQIANPGDGRLLETERTFQVLWDGTAVRYTSSAREIGSHGEGFFYWDREAKQIGFFLVHSRGVVRRGTVTVVDGLLTVQGTISFPDRTFNFRNTFEITSDGKLIDRWFQNAFGDWRPGHVVSLTATPLESAAPSGRSPVP